MPVIDNRNADQIAYWNGAAGRCWTDQQQMQDVALAPASAALLAKAAPKAGESVIDIGCGCGATSFALARAVGANGRVVGVDISEPMLGRARQLAPPDTTLNFAPVDFVLADATVHPFAPAAADLLFSRFGVMFFAEPATSFANMRRALRRGGRLAFACWRTPRENPWMMLGLKEAYKYVPKLPPMQPDDPGPFAFASEERVHRILDEAGFAEVQMEPVDLFIDVAAGRGLEAAVQSTLSIGPTSLALENQPAEKVAAATQSIREVLASHLKGDTVPLSGAIWLVTATNPT
jgi:ubiquinone/menaquinone biosynthesis C-methylase UbiE